MSHYMWWDWFSRFSLEHGALVVAILSAILNYRYTNRMFNKRLAVERMKQEEERSIERCYDSFVGIIHSMGEVSGRGAGLLRKGVPKAHVEEGLRRVYRKMKRDLYGSSFSGGLREAFGVKNRKVPVDVNASVAATMGAILTRYESPEPTDGDLS